MEKQIIFLDTSVLIDYFRKTNKSNSLLFKLAEEFDLLAVSSITEYEIYCGSNVEQDSYWDDFFSKVIIFPFDSSVNRETIKIERDLRKKNTMIDKPDIMIAATAIVNNLKLATLNVKHFQKIENLKLVAQ